MVSTTLRLVSKDDCFLLLSYGTDTGWPGSMTGILTAQENGFSFVQGSVFQTRPHWLWGRTVLCCGDCPMHWWMFSRIPALLDASSSSPSGHCDFAKCPLGGKTNPGWEPLIWGENIQFWRRLESLRVSLRVENVLSHVASGSWSACISMSST